MFTLDIQKSISKHGKFNFLSSDIYIGKSLQSYGEYSEIELSILLSLLKKKDIVFDIGSNIGAFTIPMSKKIGRTGKVFSFEPQNLIHDIQLKNIKENNIPNVRLFQNGISSKSSTINLCQIDYSVQDNFGGVSLIQDNSNPFYPGDNDPTQEIKMITLDDFLFLKKCDLIKIDVESMEMQVLIGGQKFLKKNRPILWIENQRVFPNKLNRFLLNSDYKLYWILSSLFNSKNFFNSNVNLFPYVCSENILAIPKEKKNYKCELLNELDEITDEFSAPQKVLSNCFN